MIYHYEFNLQCFQKDVKFKACLQSFWKENTQANIGAAQQLSLE